MAKLSSRQYGDRIVRNVKFSCGGRRRAADGTQYQEELDDLRQKQKRTGAAGSAMDVASAVAPAIPVAGPLISLGLAATSAAMKGISSAKQKKKANEIEDKYGEEEENKSPIENAATANNNVAANTTTPTNNDYGTEGLDNDIDEIRRVKFGGRKKTTYSNRK